MRLTITLLITSIAILPGYTQALMNSEFLQETRTTLEAIVPDEVYGNKQAYLTGFAEGLSEIEELPYDASLLKTNLSFFVIRNLINNKGVATHESGKLAAYSVIRLTTYRSKIGSTILSVTEASPKIELLNQIESKVVEIVKNFSLQQEERILFDINKFFQREKRSLTDPLYYNSPEKINAFHVASIGNRFEQAAREILDLTNHISRLRARYPNIGLTEQLFPKESTNLHYRAVTLPQLLIQMMMETIPRFSVFPQREDFSSINHINQRYHSLDYIVQDQKRPYVQMKNNNVVLPELNETHNQLIGL